MSELSVAGFLFRNRSSRENSTVCDSTSRRAICALRPFCRGTSAGSKRRANEVTSRAARPHTSLHATRVRTPRGFSERVTSLARPRHARRVRRAPGAARRRAGSPRGASDRRPQPPSAARRSRTRVAPLGGRARRDDARRERLPARHSAVVVASPARPRVRAARRGGHESQSGLRARRAARRFVRRGDGDFFPRSIDRGTDDVSTTSRRRNQDILSRRRAPTPCVLIRHPRKRKDPLANETRCLEASDGNRARRGGAHHREHGGRRRAGAPRHGVSRGHRPEQRGASRVLGAAGVRGVTAGGGERRADARAGRVPPRARARALAGSRQSERDGGPHARRRGRRRRRRGVPLPVRHVAHRVRLQVGRDRRRRPRGHALGRGRRRPRARRRSASPRRRAPRQPAAASRSPTR